MRESSAGHRGVVVNFMGGMALRGSLHSVTPFSFMGVVPGWRGLAVASLPHCPSPFNPGLLLHRAFSAEERSA